MGLAEENGTYCVRTTKWMKILGGPVVEVGTRVYGHGPLGGYLWASYENYPLVLSPDQYEMFAEDQDLEKLLEGNE